MPLYDFVFLDDAFDGGTPACRCEYAMVGAFSTVGLRQLKWCNGHTENVLDTVVNVCNRFPAREFPTKDPEHYERYDYRAAHI
jgi:hypothetical protein